jgi:signal transduction histidine kinase
LLVDLAANPGESRTLETRVRHGDGEYRWVEATLTNLSRDPAVSAHVANYRIIDERKRAENLRQQLMSRVISAQEDERKRIAADIHDDSVQVMAAVQLRLHSLARTKGEAERQKALDYLEETVRLSITRLRRLMFELRPAALDRDGLASAIETNLQMMAGETGIEPSIHWSLASEPPLESRVVLYRIVQEALANVRKHAHAKHLSVSVEGSDDGILVRVADDGIGFAGPWENKPDHIGLAAMRERAEGISGWLRIESDPGRGTTVHVWAPLPQPVDSAMQHAGVA